MEIPIIMVDLFSGAGGVTTGAERAKVLGQKACKVIAAVNHDELAIESHRANHPETHHFVEDIRVLEMHKLMKLVKQARAEFPEAILILWASLECTNFSKAKGGMPRDADSRSLADHMDRYIEALRPDIFYFENVVEFMSWGPLDEKGKPESRTCGRDYIMWINRIRQLGYQYESKVLNAANYGAYTSRERMFGQFVRHGLPICWPQATHSKKPVSDQFGTLKPWQPVRKVLDLHNYGESIFDREKPYVDNTLERILAGLVKFVAKGENNFLQKYYSGRPDGKVISLDGPAGAQTTTDSHALVTAPFLIKYNSSGADGNKRNAACNILDPCPVVATQNRLGLCTAFMTSYYGNSKSAQSIEQPAGTITTKDRIGLVHAEQFISRNFTKGGQNQSLDKPAGSLLAVPKMNLVTPFMIDQNFRNLPRSIDEPANTVLACRKHQYLVNPQYGNVGCSIEQPSPVIIARQDKKPLALATAVDGRPKHAPMPGDSEVMLKIKAFMKEYNIADIYMRMLTIPELKRIMGFGDGYTLHGSQKSQKKFIGNAVETTQAQRNIEAVAFGILEFKKKIA